MYRLLLIFCLLAAGQLMAQLPMNRTFQRVYDGETRSLDGMPGAKYWQNRADYVIDAEFDPVAGTVRGSETITYTNNSPDELEQIVVHLKADIFKKGNAREFNVNPDDLTDGTELTRVIVGDETIDVSNPATLPARYSRGAPPKVRRTGTNLYLRPERKIAPGETRKIEIDWSFVMPRKTSLRIGTYGTGSYFVGYWFPQIAVYDDIHGWNTQNYTGMVETYNEFGSFDVRMSLPKSHLMWATGTLQNPEEVLSRAALKQYRKAQTADETVNIVTAEDWAEGRAARNTASGYNTWNFSVPYSPDFAFAVSDSFLWDGRSVVVEPNSGERRYVDVAYRRDSEFYDEAADILAAVVRDLSVNLPGVPYPYPAATVFNGSGGMEFPGIVNDGPVSSRFGLLTLTHHELAHSYFPFYMGTNEQRYAWMDEGWASFLPLGLAREMIEDAPDPRMWNAMSHARIAGGDENLPLMTPTYLTVYGDYRDHAYSKPMLAYLALHDLLGEETFKYALLTYMNRWNGKHPLPYDFFNSFEAASNQDLDWFWEPWFFETTPPDLGLDEVEIEGKEVEAEVKNKTGLPVSLRLVITFEDGSKEIIARSPMIWKDSDEFEFEQTFDKAVRSVRLGTPDIPDVDDSDNLSD